MYNYNKLLEELKEEPTDIKEYYNYVLAEDMTPEIIENCKKLDELHNLYKQYEKIYKNQLAEFNINFKGNFILSNENDFNNEYHLYQTEKTRMKYFELKNKYFNKIKFDLNKFE
jgi:hypothetical protein